MFYFCENKEGEEIDKFKKTWMKKGKQRKTKAIHDHHKQFIDDKR